MSRKSKKDKKAKETLLTQGDQPETPATEKPQKLSNKEFNKELERLQGELVKLQYWVKEKGLRVIVVFEGHDGRRHPAGQILARCRHAGAGTPLQGPHP